MVQKWKPVIRRYLTENIGYLRGLVDEIRLLLSLAALVQKMRALGLPICKPEVCDMADRTFVAEGLYNPFIALSLKDPSIEMVLNDLSFDEDGMIYILTGANQGGKSATTYAVGIAQALCQLGAFVPAKSARISPVDHILTNFPAKEVASIGKGRLGEECARLRSTLEKATECSLVLMARRAEGRYMGGTWQLISGGLEPNETAWEAALREMSEETSLTPAEFYRLDTVTAFYRPENDSLNIAPMFCAIVNEDAVVTINSEHTAFVWIDVDEANSRLMWPGDRQALEEVRTTILTDSIAKEYMRIPIVS